MSNTTKLLIKDQVNVTFQNLDPLLRRKISESLKFFVPYARHMPAFKLGRWDGKVGFFTVGGSSYLNLLDRILPMVIDAGYEIEIDDRRTPIQLQFPEVTETIFADRQWPIGHPVAGEPIMLRDYQVKAINTYLANPQSIQEISTGAGKTLLTATLSYLVEDYGRSIIIVPSKSLVEQTEEDYLNLGLDVGVFYGDRKEWGHKHTICTWQSLAIFSKKTRRDEVDIGIDEFLADVVCVMVDETHTAKASELKDLLCGAMAGIPIRWGLTGTVPKDEHEFLCLLVSLGPKVGDIRASDLQEKGVLANCNINIWQLQDDDLAFADYAAEYDYLTSNKDRLDFIAESCREIAKSGNMLVLVDRIECGEYLTAAIGDDAVFISGRVKTKDRKKEYKEVQTASNKVIIATYGVAAVGINIPRIFNLVLVEAGKSFTRVIQSIGRGIRTAEDKDAVEIYDITSSLKFSKKHLSKRKEYYRDAKYPHAVKKISFK